MVENNVAIKNENLLRIFWNKFIKLPRVFKSEKEANIKYWYPKFEPINTLINLKPDNEFKSGKKIKIMMEEIIKFVDSFEEMGSIIERLLETDTYENLAEKIYYIHSDVYRDQILKMMEKRSYVYAETYFCGTNAEKQNYLKSVTAALELKDKAKNIAEEELERRDLEKENNRDSKNKPKGFVKKILSNLFSA